MSGKMGKRVTAKKPAVTRRHDALATGAFGDSSKGVRSEQELNKKIIGKPSTAHSKYQQRKKAP